MKIQVLLKGSQSQWWAFRTKMKAIRDELEEWKRCYKDLESETTELFLCYKEKIENLRKGCAGKDTSQIKK